VKPGPGEVLILTGAFASSVSQFKRASDFVGGHSRLIEQVISPRCALDDIVEAVERVKNGRVVQSVILFV